MVPPAWITKQSLAAQGICALVQVPVRSPYLNTANVASGILFVWGQGPCLKRIIRTTVKRSWFSLLHCAVTQSDRELLLKDIFKADIQESPGTKKKVMKQHQSPVCTTDVEPEEGKSDTVPQWIISKCSSWIIHTHIIRFHLPCWVMIWAWKMICTV